MSIFQTDTGIVVTRPKGSKSKGAKKSKANKPSRQRYRGSGKMYVNHASKLERLARKFERRIERGATPPKKVEGLKKHIKGLREAAERWKNKRFK